MSSSPPAVRTRGTRAEGWFGAFVELFAISALAVAQPWFDVTAQNSEVLVVHGATWLEAVELVVLVMVVPPAVALGLELLAGLVSARARAWTHAVLGGVFVAVLGAEAARHVLGGGPAAVVAAGLTAGIVGAVALGAFPWVGRYLRYLGVVALVFPIVFLTASPAVAVLGGDREGQLARGRRPSPVRVVLIVLDELPTMSLLDGTGHIDRGLYPNLAALADTATWYRNHTTVAGYTAGAVPAILTGRYPTRPAVLPTLENYPHNLFTLMGGTGVVNGREAVTRLCPVAVCGGRHDGIGALTSATWRLWRDFAAPSAPAPRTVDVDQARQSIDTGRAFVRSLRVGTGLRLDFVHLELPHFPWERLPNMQRYGVPDGPPGESYSVTPGEPGATTARLRHLLQVQAADTMVGRILDRLRRLGIFDDALVMVTADHGVSFVPGTSVRNPTDRNLASVMWAPLLVKFPGQDAPVVDERRSESIDIVPTIADVAGLRLPWRVDGVSLRGAPPARATRRLYPWIWRPGPLDVQPPPGRTFVEVDGRAEYRTVLAAAAAPPGGDPGLRLYRIGPYGALVGRTVPSPVAGAACRATVDDAGRFDHVRRTDGELDWVWSRGRVLQAPAGSTWLAVLDHGRVAALAARQPDGTFVVQLPPSLVTSGRNVITLARVTGPPTAPVLERCTS